MHQGQAIPLSCPPPHSRCASGCTWSTARATAPSPGRPTPGVVKQDKSSGGSVDTTKTRSEPQRVRMSGGERPIGAARGKQSDTEALCHPPPPHRDVLEERGRGGRGPKSWCTQNVPTRFSLFRFFLRGSLWSWGERGVTLSFRWWTAILSPRPPPQMPKTPGGGGAIKFRGS